MVRLKPGEFEKIIQEGMRAIPETFLRKLDNVSIVVVMLKFLVDFFSKAWIIVLGAAIGIFLGRIITGAGKRAEARKRERESSREFREARAREKDESYTGLYKLLACRPGLTPAVSDLPPERRTFRLRFLDLKARVCRPYAAR